MQKNMIAPVMAALIAAIFCLTVSLPAMANSTGLENIHTLKREGNKLCMVGHYHYGSGDSEKSRKIALKKALSKWAEFVYIEYGSDWSQWRLANSRGIKCYPENGGIHCRVHGRPCKRLRARRRRHRRCHHHRQQAESHSATCAPVPRGWAGRPHGSGG